MNFTCPDGILGTSLVDFGFFGLVLFFVEDVRCAEGIPGNIG